MFSVIRIQESEFKNLNIIPFFSGQWSNNETKSPLKGCKPFILLYVICKKIVHNSSPKHFPCGTPHFTALTSEYSPYKNCISRYLIKLFIHTTTNNNFFNNKRLWSTLSSATGKSGSATLTTINKLTVWGWFLAGLYYCNQYLFHVKCTS